MKISLEPQGGGLIARIHASTLDVGNARAFKQTLIAAAGEKGLVLVVDLTAVEEIDSSGLGALVAVLKAMRMFGGTVMLASAKEQVRSVLELTMIDRILPLYETVEEALASAPATGCAR